MILIALTLAVVAQLDDPVKITQEIVSLEQKLQDQTKAYERLSKQGRTTYARDKYKQMVNTQGELQEKRSQLDRLSAMTQNKALAERSNAIVEKMQRAREARLAEEKTLLANGAKKTQTVVVGTSLANYINTETAYVGTAGGVAYCKFDASASGVEMPRPAVEHSMEYLLVVDTQTAKVIGAALVATRFDQTVTDTALNAARQRCVTVHRDVLNHFDGVTADGIEITIRGGLPEIFRGQTWVSYTDPELFKKAVKKGGMDSGF